VSVPSKRKPALEPEQDVWTVDGATVTLTPPGDSREHGPEAMVVPAVFLDAVDEPEELTPGLATTWLSGGQSLEMLS
jgi:hypothetical protein